MTEYRVGNKQEDGANDPALVQHKGMMLDDYITEAWVVVNDNPAITGSESEHPYQVRTT
jgi:hypothetical protein